MTISLRRLSRQEADTMFALVQTPGRDLILEMALKLVEQRSALRTRTLLAHLRSWDRENLSDGQWSREHIEELALSRALGLLAVEAESRPHSGQQEAAAWTRRRLAQLLAESAIATNDAKQILADRVNGAAA